MTEYHAKPHKIKAFRAGHDPVPDWYKEAEEKGRVASTNSPQHGQYITIWQPLRGKHGKRGVTYAEPGDWVCMNSSGTIFPLTDSEFRNGFEV
jgi:hypothetical protein